MSANVIADASRRTLEPPPGALADVLPVGVCDDPLPGLAVLLVDVVLEHEPDLRLLAALEQPLEHAPRPLGRAPVVRPDVSRDAREDVHLVVAVENLDATACGSELHSLLDVGDGLIVERGVS